jgi:hypothetical protein
MRLTGTQLDAGDKLVRVDRHALDMLKEAALRTGCLRAVTSVADPSRAIQHISGAFSFMRKDLRV